MANLYPYPALTASFLPQFFPPPPGFSAYGTSMVAKARFFESVAAENPDLRVHNVHPGAVDTEMGKKASDAGMKLPLDDGEFFPPLSSYLATCKIRYLTYAQQSNYQPTSSHGYLAPKQLSCAAGWSGRIGMWRS